MGWKWNDVANLLRETGEFTEPQIGTVSEIVTRKKWDLVEILEGRAAAEVGAARSLVTRHAAFAKGRASAFREVIEGVRPHA